MPNGTIKVNEDLRTTYYLVRAQPNLADYPEYDRSLWSIAGFSSEEPAEAQWGNGGQALHTLMITPALFGIHNGQTVLQGRRIILL